MDLKEKYKDIDPYIIKAMIQGTINIYFSMQMSNVNLKKIKYFDKNADKVLDYTSEFISNILLDALCIEVKEKNESSKK